MYWNQEKNAITLSAADMVVMGQCHISIEKWMQQRKRKQLPPVWSVLSYAMLRYHGDSANKIWREYRNYEKMFSNTDRYYYKNVIPKASGGVRILSVPCSDLRYEQAYILDHILRHLPVDSHACAYRKGVSLKDCAAPHLKHGVLIRLDLKNFFSMVTENMVYDALLESTGYAKKLCRFLARLCCHNKCLPQGAATSPMLSNIVFRKCDEALAILAKHFGMTYTRYSDDLYFSGDNVDVDRFIKQADLTVQLYGFKLNEEKTKVRRQQHRQSVLGLTVNEKLQVSRGYKRKLLQEVYYLERYGKNCDGAIAEGDYLRYVQRLLGKVTYALSICSDDKLETVRTKLQQRIFLIEREFY